MPSQAIQYSRRTLVCTVVAVSSDQPEHCLVLQPTAAPGCHVSDQSSRSPLSRPTASTSLPLPLQPLQPAALRGAKAMLVTGAAICGSLATDTLESSAGAHRTLQPFEQQKKPMRF